MAQTLNVITIHGSLRRGSFNHALARALPKLAPSDMKITQAPPWSEIPIYNADDERSSGFPAPVQALAGAIRAADGVIIVSPEYNYGLPGGLKNAIDWVSRTENQPFKEKPVAIQSATGGPLGGSRVQYQWRQVMVFLDALVFTRPEIFVGSAQTKFDDKLELKDQPTVDFIRQQLAGFEKFIRKVSGKS
ncbi:MAG TPA: NADPH-dependent FMN reductase [Xanthobacteraceae bacterium]|nr:NADPH-dependent FMN reductase [Xanthobacteraceae bacterium]